MIELLRSSGLRLVVPMFDGAIVAPVDLTAGARVEEATLNELARQMREKHGVEVTEKPLIAPPRGVKRVKEEKDDERLKLGKVAH